jgi:hypothetical protein
LHLKGGEIFLRFTSSYHCSGMKTNTFKFHKILSFYLLSPPLSIQSSRKIHH